MKYLFSLLVLSLLLVGCESKKSSDQIESERQSQALAEMVKQVGPPAIVNYQEKKLLKQTYELRDQENLITYTYTVGAMDGKLRFLFKSIGYGIPAATQYNSPLKVEWHGSTAGYMAMPQAEPNGTFPPSNADGTWVTALDDNGEKHVVYVEPRIVVSPFKLNIQ